MQENFRIGCGLENVTVGFHLGAEFGSVCDVPVVGDRDLPPFAADQNRLSVREGGGTCGAVTHMANACKTLQFVDVVIS